MFDYQFMVIAFIVGILLSIIIPLLGTNMVLKNLSMTGDTLSHTSLCGIAIGLCAGFNPLLGAILISIISAFFIELIRKKMKKYADIALAIVFATAVGITGILSGYSSSSNFSSYLFGSIVLINNMELISVIIIFLLVILFYSIFYKQIFFIAYNENQAKLSGINANLINFISTILLSVTIAISSKTIGALIISSLLVVPVASSLLISKSYRLTHLISIIFSIISMILGLILSFYLDLKPGATIVLFSVFFFIVTYVITSIIKVYQRKKILTLQCTHHDK